MNSIADSLLLAAQLITRADADLWRIVALSLRVSATACVLGAVHRPVPRGVAGGGALFRPSARWCVLNTLLALPSVVVGLVVYLLLSRSGPLGVAGHPVHAQGDGDRADAFWCCRWSPRCRASSCRRR